MRAKLVNEAIKHLGPKSQEELKLVEDKIKVVFYHHDTNEFEYKGKKRIYTSTPNEIRFLRTKDYLVYVYKNMPFGFVEADSIATWLSSGYGAIYKNKLIYNEDKHFLKTLCKEKYQINEAIKHLTPKSNKEIRDGIMALPPQERLVSAVRHDIEFTDEEMEQYKRDLYNHIMQKHPKFRLKAAKLYNVTLTPDDIDKTEQDLVKEFQQTYKTQDARNTMLLHAIKSGKLEDIKYMIAAGADVNCYNGKPLETLIKSYKQYSKPGAQVLLQYGADPTLNDRIAIKMIKEKIKEIEENKEYPEYFTTWENKQILKYQQILKLLRNYESKIS